MAVQRATERQQEIRKLFKDYKWFYQVFGGGLLVLIGILVGSLLFVGDAGYGTNLYTELISIAVTVAIVDRLSQRRATEQLQKRLIREAGGRVNDMAVSAVRWLRAEGWLLKNTNLIRANLQGAYLQRANLQRANLKSAKFDEKTTLPDAVWNHETKAFEGQWMPETDIERFTNPEHPDFWRPEPNERGWLTWWARDGSDE